MIGWTAEEAEEAEEMAVGVGGTNCVETSEQDLM